MAKQTASEILKESIRQLEIRQAEEGEQLKAQFKNLYESLKPVNLLKSSIKEFTDSVEFKGSLFESAISVFTGYLTKKLLVGPKSNLFMKLAGLALQFGVTKLVAQNADVIREYIARLIDRFLPAKEESEA